jgi:hypothetical protein
VPERDAEAETAVPERAAEAETANPPPEGVVSVRLNKEHQAMNSHILAG